MKSNGQRLWHSLMEMAKIGATNHGGNTRLALTDLDVAGRELLIEWAKTIGLSVHYDAIGNLFLRREGIAHVDPIVIGSHLDTQPKGGRFDGIYGVLSGLEVIRILDEHKIQTYHPIELVVWMNEEGARFTPAMMGSAVFTGLFSLEHVLAITDKENISVESELQRTSQIGSLALGRPFSAYYELHIEQGPILENNQIEIGIVTGGQAIIWLDAITSGKAAHAGTTPMNVRQDGLIATANMISQLEVMVLDQYPEGLITFGEISIANSSRNTIPSTVQWTIDLRHKDDDKLIEMEQKVKNIIEKNSMSRGVDVSLKRHWHSPATYFSEKCIQTVQTAVRELGFSHQKIVSGAGHDAINLAKHCPTTMIFIPCEGGLSHNEAESITQMQAEQGADVLLNAILKADELGKLPAVS